MGDGVEVGVGDERVGMSSSDRATSPGSAIWKSGGWAMRGVRKVSVPFHA